MAVFQQPLVEARLLIKVRYPDHSCAIVDQSHLDALIRRNEITAFRRADGWAVIGRDRTRGSIRERRRPGALVNIYV